MGFSVFDDTIHVSDQPVEPSSGRKASTFAPSDCARLAITCHVVPMTESPVLKACDLTSKGFCESYHAGDEAYAEKIHYWTTPIEQCLDGRTDVTCTTYQDWTQAWTEIKG